MLWGGFVWDDNIYIKVDPVRDVSGLWQIWFSPSTIEEERHYWPLVYTTFWLEHKLWGFAPAGYHIVNVLLHLANRLVYVTLCFYWSRHLDSNRGSTHYEIRSGVWLLPSLGGPFCFYSSSKPTAQTVYVPVTPSVSGTTLR